MTYEQVPIRLQLAIISTPPVAPIDGNTGATPVMWRGQSLAIDIGIFAPSGAAVDLANLQYLQLLIQDGQDALVPVANKIVLAAQIIPTITVADWNAGTAQQAEFRLDNSETDFSLGGASQKTYWLVILGKTNAGAVIVYGAGPLVVVNPTWVLPPPVPQGLVSANQQTNNTGDSTVTPESQLHTEEITVTGAAGNRNVILTADSLVEGARLAVRFILPAVDSINLILRDQAVDGPILATITSAADGFTPAAYVDLWFDGANFRRAFLVIPAFGQQT